MTNILTVQDIHGYINEEGIAYLNLEDVVRNMGFTTIDNDSGKEYVRWSVVNSHLKNLGCAMPLDKDAYISESTVHRLAVKTTNVAAKNFQINLVEDILPAMRKMDAINKIDPVYDLAGCIEEIGEVANAFKKVFDVDTDVALNQAITLIEKNNNINIDEVRQLIPQAKTTFDKTIEQFKQDMQQKAKA